MKYKNIVLLKIKVVFKLSKNRYLFLVFELIEHISFFCLCSAYKKKVVIKSYMFALL